MKVLYLIPARGGSVSIPNKNIKELYGKRLIYYTIDSAREVAKDHDICVSTDSQIIAEAVNDYGLEVPFIRPKEFATEFSPTSDVIKHAYDFYQKDGIAYDVIAVLQPTSPFRNGKHIEEALDLFTFDLDLVASVYLTKSNPYFVLYEEDIHGFLVKSKIGSFERRQDCPPVYQLNGAIYLLNAKSIDNFAIGKIQKIKAYLMEELYSLDIDTEIDWEFAEFALQKGLLSV